MQVGLCIAESYYITGLYRIEYFDSMKLLEGRLKDLDQSVTTWILGKPVPKRRKPTQWT
jgi:hypothetical protein